jgi:hypothetical protein
LGQKLTAGPAVGERERGEGEVGQRDEVWAEIEGWAAVGKEERKGKRDGLC